MNIKVTSIKRYKNSSNRYIISFDSGDSFTLSGDDLIKERIAKGDDISESYLRKLKISSTRSLLLEKSLNYLSRRPHSKKEVSDYLGRKVFQNKDISYETDKRILNESIEEVLNTLEEKGYINDTDFAKWFVEQRQKQSKGTKLISQELRQKGIDSSTIADLFSEGDSDEEIQRARHQALKKIKRLRIDSLSDYKDKQKVLNFLLGKGFSYKTSIDAVDSIISET